nr:glycoside hydrolase family 32 protein [uncultured Bacteroides sp.]
MKLNYIVTTLLSLASLTACSDQEYVCNDPNADLSAPSYFDVNDLHQTYASFWKPSNGWVGDPMPFYENGKFHVFYLLDARNGAATFHPWAKTTTSDFMTYEDNGEVIPCGADGSQEDALGTGSVIKAGDTYYAYYTAHNANLNPAEKIYLATSKDMKTWTKQTNFSLQAANGYDANEFRDPFVMKEGNVYKMFITTRGYVAAVNDWQAVIAQYSSTDLLNWKLEEPFYYNGERVMECPDVFTMGNYQYLVYSNWDWANNDRKVHYRYRVVGTNDWKVPSYSALDGIAYYAGKTASDGTNRFLFGWCPTRSGNNDTSDYGWAGSLVVHQLTQNSDGTLNVTIPASVDQKLKNEVVLKALVNNNAQVQGNSYTLNGTSGKAIALFDRQKGTYKITTTVKASTATRFGFEFGAGGARSEVHDLVFDLTSKTLKLDCIKDGNVLATRTSTPLIIPENKQFKVTIVIENSVCVIYVNGVIALSNRIYQMNQNPWGIFAEGGEAVFSEVALNK